MLARLFFADLKMILRNRQALFWAIVFPLLFTVVFGLFRFDDIGEAEVAVFGDQRGSRVLERGIDEADAPLVLASYDDRERALADLADDEIEFVLTVDERGTVEVAFNEATADRNAVFLPVLRSVINEINLQVAGVDRAFDVEEDGIAGVSLQYFDFVLPGLVGMAVMTYGIIGLGSTIAQYRAQRILKRIRATPLSPATFIASVVLAHLALAVVQSSIVLLVGSQLFGGTVRGSLLWLYLFVVLGNVTFLNIGFMVASRAESAEAASGFGNAIAMPMMFFSGVFFPTAGLPWILPALTALLPLHPMLDAIRAISIEGASITGLWTELAQVLAWGVVSFVVAARVFRFERA